MGSTISTGAVLPERSAYSSPSQRQASATAPSPTTPVNRSGSPISTRKAAREKQEADRQTTRRAVGLLIGIFLAGALTGKAISSGRRARHAESSAKSWERVCLAIAGNNKKRLPHQHQQQQPHTSPFGNGESRGRHRDREHTSSWAEKKVLSKLGVGDGPGDKSIYDVASGIWGDNKHRLSPQMQRTSEDWWEVLKEGAEKGSQSATAAQKDVNTAAGTADRSPYAAIHPHEDWDWTPADHPRPRKGWQKKRLPPWTVGFTSSPKAQEKTSEMKNEMNPLFVPHEDSQLRSAIWPVSEANTASEADYVANEDFGDMKRSSSEEKPEPMSAKAVIKKYSEEAKAKEEKRRIRARESIRELSRRLRKEEEKRRLKATQSMNEAERRKVISQRRLEEEEKEQPKSRSKLEEKLMAIKKEKIRKERLSREADEAAKAKMQERVRRIKERSEAFFSQRAAKLEAEKKGAVQSKPEAVKEHIKFQLFYGETELNETLQRQMWALMARAEALEEKLRRYDSNNNYK